MTVSEARTLRKGDDVIWTWTQFPDQPQSEGKVAAVNDRAVSIEWYDEITGPSVFFFDDDLPWQKIERTREEPHYEPEDFIGPTTFHSPRGPS